MRWETVRLVWMRELRDLIRDRRWLFMLLGLPVLIYPLFGLVGFVFAVSLLDSKNPVGVVGIDHLPPGNGAVVSAAEASWLAGDSLGSGLADRNRNRIGCRLEHESQFAADGNELPPFVNSPASSMSIGDVQPGGDTMLHRRFTNVA